MLCLAVPVPDSSNVLAPVSGHPRMSHRGPGNSDSLVARSEPGSGTPPLL